jgi:dCTP deaminase
MAINGRILLEAAPIKDMLNHKVRTNGVSHGLSEAGYDIRIKQDVYFYPYLPEAYIQSNPVSIGTTVVDGQEVEGRFALASAIEEFNMPPNLLGIVHDKSTWARHGLSVFNTVIEPGWRGFLTLELVYHGQKDLYIPAGSGIAQVIFHAVSCPTQYEGKYQDQKDQPIDPIFEHRGDQ